MPGRTQNVPRNWVTNLRDLALSVLVIGCTQVVLSLIPWLLLFRDHPQGLSMALSLSGFGGWIVGFASTVGAGRTQPSRSKARQQSAPDHSPTDAADVAPSPLDGLRRRIERAGCGLTLFLSSILPLALAFFLRLQADLQSGKTWEDIFPTLP
jgi:hypothetical protein